CAFAEQANIVAVAARSARPAEGYRGTSAAGAGAGQCKGARPAARPAAAADRLRENSRRPVAACRDARGAGQFDHPAIAARTTASAETDGSRKRDAPAERTRGRDAGAAKPAAAADRLREDARAVVSGRL